MSPERLHEDRGCACEAFDLPAGVASKIAFGHEPGSGAMYHTEKDCISSLPPKECPMPPIDPSVKRFFLAHPKSYGDGEIEAACRRAQIALAAVSKGKPFVITPGRAFYEQRFKAAGSWEAWTREVATGVDPVTRAPIFHAILVPGTGCGAGTARMVEHAISAGKPVFSFDEAGARRVVRVTCDNREDWQNGYSFQF